MSVDFRGIPTASCPLCGSLWLKTAIKLDPETYEITGWLLDNATCFDCGSKVTLACPTDHPDYR